MKSLDTFFRNYSTSFVLTEKAAFILKVDFRKLGNLCLQVGYITALWGPRLHSALFLKARLTIYFSGL